MIYWLAIIFGLIVSFMRLASEVAAGNIAHLKDGRPPNAGAAIFPAIPAFPLLALGVAWLLHRVVPDYAVWFLCGSFAVLAICWMASFARLRSELNRWLRRTLSLETQRRVEVLFRVEDRAAASRMLVEECGNNLPFLKNSDERELERYRFAALKLSRGDLGRLRQAIELAKTDWRDLLVAAGFAEDVRAHNRWNPEK